MKEVFDREAFGGCLLLLALVIAVPVIAFVGYVLFHLILYLLPVAVAVLIILAAPYVLWRIFREVFFKKIP